jgi:hypothetical protein
MAKVALPDRGQPLDLAYIYQLAQAINNLSDQLSPTTAKYTSIRTADNTNHTVRTSDARIVGEYITVTNTSATTSGAETPFTVQFSDFAYTPAVTATPLVAAEATRASTDVSVILTNVTTNTASGIVKFNTIGVSSVGVNLLIVGIPV